MDQSEYDGLTPQEQIDIFERVSLKTAVDMIAQIDGLKAEVAKLRKFITKLQEEASDDN